MGQLPLSVAVAIWLRRQIGAREMTRREAGEIIGISESNMTLVVGVKPCTDEQEAEVGQVERRISKVGYLDEA